MVSEKVEKSSPVGLAAIKHSSEGRREPLDNTTGRKDCPKSQVRLINCYLCLFVCS